MRRADRALYRAKKTGKNRVELFWSDDSGPRLRDRRPLDGDDDDRRRKRAERKVGLGAAVGAREADRDDRSERLRRGRSRRRRGGRARARGAGRAAQGRAREGRAARGVRSGRDARWRSGATAAARAVLGGLWDHAPAVSAGAIAGVIEDDLGEPPQALFARWDPTPLAAASLGQVHAATLARRHRRSSSRCSTRASPRRCARISTTPAFVRKLAGAEIGARARRRRAARARRRGARRARLPRRGRRAARGSRAAWADHPALRFPRVIDELSSARVLTMTRARGKTVVEAAASGDAGRCAARPRSAIFEFAWGSPLVHGLLNADPNPGNFLVDDAARRRASHVWCLDFGCALELPDDGARRRSRDLVGPARRRQRRRRRAVPHGPRARGPARAAPTRSRRPRTATGSARSPRRSRTHGDFHWTRALRGRARRGDRPRARAPAASRCRRSVLLLWRQRLGAAAVIGMLDARAPFRRVLVELIGTGRRALR